MSREFPQAIEMEKKLLSAMMLKESTVIPTIEAILDANDFYRPEHRLIYQALVRVYKRGTPPDILLVEDELKRTGDLEKVNRSYLFSLIDYEWTTSRAQEHAKTIKERREKGNGRSREKTFPVSLFPFPLNEIADNFGDAISANFLKSVGENIGRAPTVS